jgi:hypothetical protein
MHYNYTYKKYDIFHSTPIFYYYSCRACLLYVLKNTRYFTLHPYFSNTTSEHAICFSKYIIYKNQRQKQETNKYTRQVKISKDKEEQIKDKQIKQNYRLQKENRRLRLKTNIHVNYKYMLHSQRCQLLALLFTNSEAKR